MYHITIDLPSKTIESHSPAVYRAYRATYQATGSPMLEVELVELPGPGTELPPMNLVITHDTEIDHPAMLQAIAMLIDDYYKRIDCHQPCQHCTRQHLTYRWSKRRVEKAGGFHHTEYICQYCQTVNYVLEYDSEHARQPGATRWAYQLPLEEADS